MTNVYILYSPWTKNEKMRRVADKLRFLGMDYETDLVEYKDSNIISGQIRKGMQSDKVLSLLSVPGEESSFFTLELKELAERINQTIEIYLIWQKGSNYLTERDLNEMIIGGEK